MLMCKYRKIFALNIKSLTLAIMQKTSAKKKFVKKNFYISTTFASMYALKN